MKPNLKIQILEEVTQKPNGDRDTTRHPCSKFTVYLVNGASRTVIQSFDQYDPWWTAIKGSRAEYLAKAHECAASLRDTLGGDAVIEGPEMTKKQQRMLKLERSIARDKAELRKLRDEPS